MAKLSSKEYKALPISEFLYHKVISKEEAKKWPSKNLREKGGEITLVRLPIMDKAHRDNAKARLNQSKTGGSPALKNRLKRKLAKKMNNEKKIGKLVDSYK